MFKDLRINTPFYVLYRGEKPRLEIGSVLSVGQPMPKIPTSYNTMFPQQPDMVVDVRVKVGDNILTFEKLPASSVIADFAAASQNMVVSSNRDNIRTEVEIMLGQSKSVIESVNYHESVIVECDNILKELNPSYVKDQNQEAEIKELKAQISELKNQLGGIDEIKQMLLNQKGNETSKGKNI
jgi:hypothetical protein